MDIEVIQKFCLSLPSATEDIKWDHNLVFSVGGKMFCIASLEPPFQYSFKVEDNQFEELILKDGFMPAPYMAKAKWVLVTNPAKLNNKEWTKAIRKSYELVRAKLSKKVRIELGISN
jgi:predicted DNA-binding protein (MmcQ/YjbR family)